ncbi:MAG: glycosyltransferase [Chloroflexi bacterium]|nr:glycosyltransferase [Chloroflexota bacterium]
MAPNKDSSTPSSVVLGTGDAHYEEMFATLAGYHQDKMTAVLAYEADLAPLIYGGSDMFLMPSLFEPCGLGQLIAMRYGSVPVVRHTGGLADTVREPRTGFVFHDFNASELWHAIQREPSMCTTQTNRFGGTSRKMA